MQVLKREDEGIPILEGAVRSFTRSVGGASVADIIVVCIYLLGVVYHLMADSRS